MSEQAATSDDFLALWGPVKPGALEPAPPRRRGQGRAPDGDGDESVVAPEREARRGHDSDAFIRRADLEPFGRALQAELDRRQAEAAAAVGRLLGHVEARVSERFSGLAHEMSEVAASMAALTARVAAGWRGPRTRSTNTEAGGCPRSCGPRSTSSCLR